MPLNTVNMKKFLFPCLISLMALVLACSGDDRSGEQPFAPTVKLNSAVAAGDSIMLEGQVTASPNSTLTACGFHWGNDTLSKTITCDEPAYSFSSKIDSLAAGQYYVVAYATNKMGTSTSDTIWCEVTASK